MKFLRVTGRVSAPLPEGSWTSLAMAADSLQRSDYSAEIYHSAIVDPGVSTGNVG
jgi:hypothetical protein